MKHTGRLHQGLNPHTRNKHRSEAAPEALLELARKDPTDRIVCIAARCVQCSVTAEAIRECQRRTCALWRLRPYRVDSSPRGAPPLEYRGIAGFGQPREQEET